MLGLRKVNPYDKIKSMNLKEAIDYWLKSAREDLKTAESLLAAKRNVHCLFFCHLFIEKTLKALVVKNTKDSPLPIHNLLRLSKNAGINLTEKQENLLDEINEFNIRARYNDVKFRFYKKATSGFARKYFEKSRRFYLWLKKRV